MRVAVADDRFPATGITLHSQHVQSATRWLSETLEHAELSHQMIYIDGEILHSPQVYELPR